MSGFECFSRRSMLLLPSIILSISACSHTGRIDYSSAAQKSVQTEALSRWNRCLDTYLSEPSDSPTNQNLSFKYTLNHCHGHQQDVVLSFPRKLENQIDKKLRAAAIQKAVRVNPSRFSNALAENAALQ